MTEKPATETPAPPATPPAKAPPAKPKSAAEQVQEQLGGVQKQAEQALGNALKGLKGLKKPSWMK